MIGLGKATKDLRSFEKDYFGGLDNTDLLNALLIIDSDLTKYKNKIGKAAANALKHGQWSVVKQIALSRMDTKMRIESQQILHHNF